MVAGEHTQAPVNTAVERHLPPVGTLSVVSLGLIIVGGIYMASYLPHQPNLVLPIVLLAASAVCMAWNVISLARVKTFPWRSFSLVARWSLLAYAIIAGMLEYVFVVDGTRGGPLIVLTLMLLVYAVDIPLLLAFSVARYQES